MKEIGTGRGKNRQAQTPDLQDLAISQDTTTVQHTKAENVNSSKYRVDLEATAEAFGIPVETFDFRQEMKDTIARKVKGVYARTKGGRQLIMVNTMFSYRERRFTLGHELAHAALAKPGLHRVGVIDDPEEERTANRIGTHLLMPRRLVQEAVREIGRPDPYKISRMFDCSLTVVRIRLRELGYFNSARNKR